MTYSEQAALQALSQIKDPRTGRDVINAGLLSDLSYKDGHVTAILQVDAKMAEHYERVRAACETALSELSGVNSARVLMTAHKAAPDVGGSRPARAQPHKARRPEGYQGDAFVDHVIAISSAKGGVGKSTLAANLAVALARQGHKVGLLDADIHGPSIPHIFGVSDQRAQSETVHGRALIRPIEAHGVKLVSIGFMVETGGAVVWRGPMVQGAIAKMLWDGNWGQLDYLLIDMPPGTGDPQLGLAQDIKPRGAVIVSTPQDLALLDARKGVQMFEKVNIAVLGIVENMSLFICPDCGSEHSIFGGEGAQREAKTLQVPFLGATPLHMDIRISGDTGMPIATGETASAQAFANIATALHRLF